MSVNPLNFGKVNIVGGYCINYLITLPDGDMLFTGNKTGGIFGVCFPQIFKESGEVTVYAGSPQIRRGG